MERSAKTISLMLIPGASSAWTCPTGVCTTLASPVSATSPWASSPSTRPHLRYTNDKLLECEWIIIIYYKNFYLFIYFVYFCLTAVLSTRLVNHLGGLGLHHVPGHGLDRPLLLLLLLHHDDLFPGLDGQECLHCRHHWDVQRNKVHFINHKFENYEGLEQRYKLICIYIYIYIWYDRKKDMNS